MTTFISGSQSVVLRLPTASAPPGKLVRNENSNLVNQTLGAGPSDLSLNKLPQGDGCKVKFGHRCLGLRAAQGSFREETYSQKVEISGPRRHGWLPWRMNRGKRLFCPARAGSDLRRWEPNYTIHGKHRGLARLDFSRKYGSAASFTEKMGRCRSIREYETSLT